VLVAVLVAFGSPPGVRDPPPATAKGYAALAAMCLIWGSTFLAIRMGNEALPPFWAASLRLAFATPLYFLIAWASGALVRDAAAIRTALVYGFLNYGVNFVLLYWGELRVPSGTAAVIYATIPLTTAVFAALLRVHPFDRRQLAGSAVGLAGVAIVFSGELTSGAPATALAAIFGAAVASALSAVVLKRGPVQSTWMVNSVGAAAGLVVCAAASVAAREPRPLPGSLEAWGPVLYLVLAGNLGAYALYGWLITQWNVVRINVIALVIPLIAVGLGALVRSEALSVGTYAGAAVVLAGVGLTVARR
jgi:drug/metabolite transporter (DMT)-like permease